MKPTILCVDGEKSVLKSLELLLAQNGYEALKAMSCEEARERLKTAPVDLLILDGPMENGHGLELCRTLKNEEKFKKIPIILVFEAGGTEENGRKTEAGAEDFIFKPFNFPELMEKIRTILASKHANPRRLGELLLDRHFIEEADLQRALRIAREKKIKIGEALISLGAVDQDHVYWTLSNQLKMEYLELSYEMIDPRLIRKFSVEKLEELRCLPLYETPSETHFAVADPTDQAALRAIGELNPARTNRLHLAIPEKIVNILEKVKQETPLMPPAAPALPSFEARPTGDLAAEKYWAYFTELLSSLPENEDGWLYRDSHQVRFTCRRCKGAPKERGFPPAAFDLLKRELAARVRKKEGKRVGYLSLRPEMADRPPLFKVWSPEVVGKELLKFNRFPLFSEERYFAENPNGPSLLDFLQERLGARGWLLLGGDARLLVKQHAYCLARKQGGGRQFPPPFFAEEEIQMCFPEAAQTVNDRFSLREFLGEFREGSPFLYLEVRAADLSGICGAFSQSCKNAVLHIPFPSAQSMREAIAKIDLPELQGKCIFIDGDLPEAL